MPGSSFFRIIRKEEFFGITGPTGSTGPIGPTGAIGYGPTGPTGLGISYISLSSGKLINYFTDGTTFITNTVLQGPSGDTISPIKTSFSGVGQSVISSTPTSNSIIFRSIKGSTSSSGKSEIKITEFGNTLTFQYIGNSDGITFTNVSPDFSRSFAGTTGTGLSLTNIRDTNYNPSNGAAVFGIKNVFEKARGLGYTGATQYISGITCNYFYDDTIDVLFPCKTAKIDPSCKANNNVDYMTTNKVYFVDMEDNYGKIIIGSPISGVNSTAFTLIVKNAKNTEIGSENRFQSANNLYWPFGVEPCFGGYGETDVYHFYSLFDSWFGSVAYSSKFNGKTFDCSRASQCTTPPCGEEPPPPVVYGACCEIDPCPPLKNINQLSASYYINAAQSTSGKLKIWGGNLGLINQIKQTIPATYRSYKVGVALTTVFSLDYNGGITAWGVNIPPLPSGNGYTALSSGPFHSLAITNSGGVTCWGTNNHGQCNVPAGLSNIKQVAAGLFHSMALRSNGQIECWGAGNAGAGGIYDFNQCDDIPVGVTFSSIAAYEFGGLGIASRGSTVYGWGKTFISAIPTGLTGVQVAGSMDPFAGLDYNFSGAGFGVARKYDGTLVSFGNPSFTVPSYSTSDISLSHIHGLAISNGMVKAWGQNTQLAFDIPCGDCGITCSLKLEENCNSSNSIFRGKGTLCSSNPCTITGPCCMNVGCAGGDQYTQCFEGITYENCVCGEYTGALSDADFFFDDVNNTCVCETDNTECGEFGACCITGTCTDGFTRNECETILGGIFTQNRTCSSLGANYCKLGRCCTIPNNDIASHQCEENVIQSRCFTENSNIITHWKQDGNCTSDKCFYIGGCCNVPSSGNCTSGTYQLHPDLADYYGNIIDPAANNICVALGGSFRGDNTNCEGHDCGTPVTLGACVIANCPTTVSVIDNVTQTQCASQGTYTRFYPNITKDTFGKVCIRLIDINGNPTGWGCYDSSNSPTPNLATFAQPDTICVLEPGSYYQLAFFPGDSCSTSCSYPDNSVQNFEAGDDVVIQPPYNPMGTMLYGKDFKQCCPISFDNLNNGNEQLAQTYSSKFDWFGYGVTFAKNSDTVASNIKFRVHVHPKDLFYTNEFEEKIKEVIWGQTGGNCAWGPIVRKNPLGNYVLNDLFAHGKTYEYYKDEGFWKITKAGYSADILLDKTFNKQPSLQFTDSVGALTISEDSTFSNNGAWRRNWGLYNTIRLFGADNAYYALNNPVPNVNYYLPNEWTVARLVDKLNKEIPVTPNSSSWFIPSLDEMAFICQNLAEIDILMEEPMEGNYWTSTGAFNESTTEGTKTDPRQIAKCGNEAWSFSISRKSIIKNDTEYPFEITVKKENRNTKLKVRAIRIELFDSTKVPLSTSEEYKLWKLQPLKWVREKI